MPHRLLSLPSLAAATPRAARVYRQPVGHDAALAELHRCAGTRFDPRPEAFCVVAAETGGHALLLAA